MRIKDVIMKFKKFWYELVLIMFFVCLCVVSAALAESGGHPVEKLRRFGPVITFIILLLIGMLRGKG
jgi:ABC-type transport system involved in cytochrome c biogenesis permease component